MARNGEASAKELASLPESEKEWGRKKNKEQFKRPEEESAPKFQEGQKVVLYINGDVRHGMVCGTDAESVCISIERDIHPGTQLRENYKEWIPIEIVEKKIQQAHISQQGKEMLGGLFKILEKGGGTIAQETKDLIEKETMTALLEGKMSSDLVQKIEVSLEIERDLNSLERQWNDTEVFSLLKKKAQEMGLTGNDQLGFAVYLKMNAERIFSAAREERRHNSEASTEQVMDAVMKKYKKRFQEDRDPTISDRETAMTMLVLGRRQSMREEMGKALQQLTELGKSDIPALAPGKVEKKIDHAAQVTHELHPEIPLEAAATEARIVTGLSEIHASTGEDELDDLEEVTWDEARYSKPYINLRHTFETASDPTKARESLIEKAAKDSLEGRAATVLLLQTFEGQIVTDKQYAEQVALAVLTKENKEIGEVRTTSRPQAEGQTQEEQQSEAEKEKIRATEAEHKTGMYVAQKLIDAVLYRLPSPLVGNINEKLTGTEEQQDSIRNPLTKKTKRAAMQDMQQIRELNEAKMALAKNLAEAVLQVRLNLGPQGDNPHESFKQLWRVEQQLRLVASGNREPYVFTLEGKMTSTKHLRAQESYDGFRRAFTESRRPDKILATLEEVAKGKGVGDLPPHFEMQAVARALLNDIREGKIKNENLASQTRERIPQLDETEGLPKTSRERDAALEGKWPRNANGVEHKNEDKTPSRTEQSFPEPTPSVVDNTPSIVGFFKKTGTFIGRLFSRKPKEIRSLSQEPAQITSVPSPETTGPSASTVEEPEELLLDDADSVERDDLDLTEENPLVDLGNVQKGSTTKVSRRSLNQLRGVRQPASLPASMRGAESLMDEPLHEEDQDDLEEIEEEEKEISGSENIHPEILEEDMMEDKFGKPLGEAFDWKEFAELQRIARGGNRFSEMNPKTRQHIQSRLNELTSLATEIGWSTPYSGQDAETSDFRKRFLDKHSVLGLHPKGEMVVSKEKQTVNSVEQISTIPSSIPVTETTSLFDNPAFVAQTTENTPLETGRINRLEELIALRTKAGTQGLTAEEKQRRIQLEIQAQGLTDMNLPKWNRETNERNESPSVEIPSPSVQQKRMEALPGPGRPAFEMKKGGRSGGGDENPPEEPSSHIVEFTPSFSQTGEPERSASVGSIEEDIADSLKRYKEKPVEAPVKMRQSALEQARRSAESTVSPLEIQRTLNKTVDQLHGVKERYNNLPLYKKLFSTEANTLQTLIKELTDQQIRLEKQQQETSPRRSTVRSETGIPLQLVRELNAETDQEEDLSQKLARLQKELDNSWNPLRNRQLRSDIETTERLIRLRENTRTATQVDENRIRRTG